MKRFPIILAVGAALIPTSPSHAQQQGADQRENIAQAFEEAARANEAAAAANRRAAALARGSGLTGPAAVAQPEAAGAVEAGGKPPADENLPPSEFTDSGSGRLFTESVEASVANGPNYRSQKATGSPELQLIATDDEKVASLSLTVDVSGSPRPGSKVLRSTLMTLTASTPLAKGGPSSFGNISGLSNGSEIKLSAVHYRSRFEPQRLDLSAVTAAETECRRIEAANPAVATLCLAEKYTNGVSAFVQKYNPAAYDSFVDGVLPDPVIFYGIEGKASQDNFEFLDQPAFVMKEQSEFSIGGTIFGGAIFNHGNTSVAASLEYGRRWKAQDPITLCQPINTLPQTQCITAAAGAPTRKTKTIAGLEVRHAFHAGMGALSEFAVAPQFTVDLQDDSYGFDLPVYLVTDGKGKLRGGVRFGYVNSKRKTGGRDDDFNLGVFVGVPFSVFSRQ